MSTDPLAFVRFRRGVVGETRRTVHLVRIPAGTGDALTALPYALTALCGEEFMPGKAEVLSSAGGMPCVQCLLLSPDPEHETILDEVRKQPPPEWPRMFRNSA